MEELVKFARYLKENHLAEFTSENLKRVKSMNIPMLKFFKHLSDEELYNMSLKSSSDFLTSLEKGTYHDKLKQSLKQWEEDKIPGISKNDILPTDLILAYYSQKISLMDFIPGFSSDPAVVIAVIKQLEEYYKDSQELAFKLMFKIKEEADRNEILNKNLKKLVEDRTKELKSINEELEAFTYTVAHDLRSPLRSINGYAQVLIEDHQTALDKEALNTLNIIINSGKKMGMLIDDLLAYTRLGRQKLQLSEIDMNKLVDSIVLELKRDLNPMANVIIHSLPALKADYTLITQAINNLVSNALKYSSKTNNPTIEIGCTQKNPSVVYFIRDNGVGFDMNYYSKMFGVFQRLHKQSEFPGTGVGLAIVKRIIDKHHGKIWADSKLGKETTFYFALN